MKLLLLLALISDLRIQFILLKGPNGLNKHEARHVIKEARDIYLHRGAGQRIRYKLAVKEDYLIGDPSLRTFGDYFWKLQSLARRDRLCRDSDACHILVPPVSDSGRLWGTGLALRCSVGTRDRFSISTAFLTGSDGQSFKERTINVIAHEIFHQLGAYHHNGTNIMDPDANAMTKAGLYPLSVLDQTRQEINFCLNARRIK